MHNKTLSALWGPFRENISITNQWTDSSRTCISRRRLGSLPFDDPMSEGNDSKKLKWQLMEKIWFYFAIYPTGNRRRKNFMNLLIIPSRWNVCFSIPMHWNASPKKTTLGPFQPGILSWNDSSQLLIRLSWDLDTSFYQIWRVKYLDEWRSPLGKFCFIQHIGLMCLGTFDLIFH